MYILIDDERDSNQNGNNDWKLGLDLVLERRDDKGNVTTDWLPQPTGQAATKRQKKLQWAEKNVLLPGNVVYNFQFQFFIF